MAGTSYHRAETALTEARKNTYCADFSLCCLSPISNPNVSTFSVIFCALHARNVTKYQISCRQMGSFKVKMHQNRFRPGLRPGPRWGSLRRSPDSLVGWGGGNPSSFPSASTASASQSPGQADLRVGNPSDCHIVDSKFATLHILLRS